MIRRLAEVLKERKIAFRENVCGSELSTIRIGGRIALLLQPRCEGELILCAGACAAMQVPYAVIGRGSNLLFSDEPQEMAVISTQCLDGVRWLSKDRIYAQSGISLVRLSVLAAKAGYGDLSFACGIPGSLGGALFMNAGAYEKEIADVVESVDVYDHVVKTTRTLFHQELSYSYRKSVFQTQKCVILGATLRLSSKAEASTVFSEMRALNRKRRAAQPVDLPSAGSVFRRPAPHIPIAKMIDEMGLRGYRIGDACVSEKHTGFIVNKGGATAADVKALIVFLQNKLEKEYGCRPDVEIRFLPEDI